MLFHGPYYVLKFIEIVLNYLHRALYCSVQSICCMYDYQTSHVRCNPYSTLRWRKSSNHTVFFCILNCICARNIFIGFTTPKLIIFSTIFSELFWIFVKHLQLRRLYNFKNYLRKDKQILVKRNDPFYLLLQLPCHFFRENTRIVHLEDSIPVKKYCEYEREGQDTERQHCVQHSQVYCMFKLYAF